MKARIRKKRKDSQDIELFLMYSVTSKFQSNSPRYTYKKKLNRKWKLKLFIKILKMQQVKKLNSIKRKEKKMYCNQDQLN